MYTQSNDVFAVRRGDNELRGLMMARNRFATFLHGRLSLSHHMEQVEASQATPTCDRQLRTPSPAMSDGEAALWASMPSSPPPPQNASLTSEVDRALLPPPVDELRACKRCYVGNACRVFRRVRPRLALRRVLVVFSSPDVSCAARRVPAALTTPRGTKNFGGCTTRRLGILPRKKPLSSPSGSA